MTIAAFCLGLAIAIAFSLWRQHRLYRQLRQVLGLLPRDAAEISLPLVSQLRRGIAQLNQYQQELEAELEFKEKLLEVAPIGYLQVDEENQLVWCNEPARQMLQIQRWEPAKTRLLLELVRSYELDQLIEQTRHQQQPSQQEWVFHPACADAASMGEVRSLTLRAYCYPLLEGQVSVFLENRQPLVQLHQSRDAFVSDLAHELRTPLTSIRLVAETLVDRLQPPMSRWVEQMLQETNRLSNLVQDWLELSQLETDPHKHLTPKPVELHSLIQRVWQTLEPLARQKELSLTYCGADSLWLKADESRLTQVFVNLFHNSIKYSPLKSSIRVEVTLLSGEDTSLSPVREGVEINIIDSGPGFASGDLPHVFERLYRGDPSRAQPPKSSDVGEDLRSPSVSEGDSPISSGSGLGLAIVKQIIHAHGGLVKASNHPETGGACLEIKLPSEYVNP
jgi:two-component system phosphate regulon sensor histidine kinase PhoR